MSARPSPGQDRIPSPNGRKLSGMCKAPSSINLKNVHIHIYYKCTQTKNTHYNLKILHYMYCVTAFKEIKTFTKLFLVRLLREL